MFLLHARDRAAPRQRRTLAAGLDGAVKRAHTQPTTVSAGLPVARDAVLTSEPALRRIAGMLRSEHEHALVAQ